MAQSSIDTAQYYIVVSRKKSIFMDYLIPFWSHTGPACIHVQCTIEYPQLGNFVNPVEKYGDTNLNAFAIAQWNVVVLFNIK